MQNNWHLLCGNFQSHCGFDNQRILFDIWKSVLYTTNYNSMWHWDWVWILYFNLTLALLQM